ncbi:MAG: hypothetical protein ABS79_07020 [Planctomycetes bacterium SCN 63-9]|nr:MAG: hypothetical protein ABS79_07020 [Planctomycetes bacterium SCN 63-9]
MPSPASVPFSRERRVGPVRVRTFANNLEAAILEDQGVGGGTSFAGFGPGSSTLPAGGGGGVAGAPPAPGAGIVGGATLPGIGGIGPKPELMSVGRPKRFCIGFWAPAARGTSPTGGGSMPMARIRARC